MRRSRHSAGEVARSHGITRVALFGSVLTRRFGTTSDVDVLVDYERGRVPSLLEAADQEIELAAIFRRPVDLIARAGIGNARDAARGKRIVETAKTLYARP